MQHQYGAQYQKVKQSTVGIRLILEPINACCSQLEISQRLRESVRLKGLLNDCGGKVGSAEHVQWAVSPSIKPAVECSATQQDMENFADLHLYNTSSILFTSNHFVLFFIGQERIMAA